MPYNSNVPQANNKLRNSQLDLLNNFQAINTGFNFNHIDLNLADAGKHKWLTMPRQTLPQPAPGLTELLIYVGPSTLTTTSELYIKRITDGVNTGVPMTARGSTGNHYWSYLPSGAICKWGSFSFSGVSFQTINMVGPAFTAAGANPSYGLTVSGNTNVTVASYITKLTGTNSFQFFSNYATASQYSYVAIGV